MRGETGASDERPGRPAPDRSLAAQLAAVGGRWWLLGLSEVVGSRWILLEVMND